MNTLFVINSAVSAICMVTAVVILLRRSAKKNARICENCDRLRTKMVDDYQPLYECEMRGTFRYKPEYCRDFKSRDENQSSKMDAVPVAHAHWYFEDSVGGSCLDYTCSACHFSVATGDAGNRCPHCGALMD